MIKTMLLSAIICSACHSSGKATPDAASETWAWASGQYGTGACKWFAACEPSIFEFDFGSGSDAQQMCAEYYESQCDTTFGVEVCESSYPQDMLSELQQCISDWTTTSCDNLCPPASCDTALTPQD